MTAIPFGTLAGTFSIPADTVKNAEGIVVPDSFTWSSTIDPSVGTVNPDGSATFVAGMEGTFDVTGTDPNGLAGTDTFQIADLVPVAVGAPTFTPS